MKKRSLIFSYPKEKPRRIGYYPVCPTMSGIIPYYKDDSLEAKAAEFTQGGIPPYPWYYWNGHKWMSDHLDDAIVGGPSFRDCFWFGVEE